MTLENPHRDLDVHMDREGLNFACTECHTTKDHEIAGRCYSVPAYESRQLALPLDTGKRIACESCHGPAPHDYGKINDHTDKVACQSCHIPYAAKEKFTKFWWDWSKAGRFDDNGKPIVKKDEHGNIIYDTKKGEFRWEKHVVPEYFWFNGSAGHIFVTDKIDPSKPVPINSLKGDYDDPNARIHPAKVHRGKQVYDPVNRTLVIPKLFGPKGSGAYWADYDWLKSVQVGMDYVGLPFSGTVDFVETEMYWPITHMVSPKEDVVKCQECHRRDSRLKNLTGFYMPGRNRFTWLDYLGWMAVILAVAGVFGHGAARLMIHRRPEDDEEDSKPEEEKLDE